MRAWTGALPLAVAAVMAVAAACGGNDSKAQVKSTNAPAATTAADSGVAGSSSSAGTTSGGSSRSSSAGTSTSGGSSSSATGRKLAVDCGDNIKSFKFDGKLAMQAPQPSGSGSASDTSALFASFLSDVKYSGQFVAPDRSSIKMEIGAKDSPISGPIEFVQIGQDNWLKLGNSGWQKSSGTGGPADAISGLDPRSFCKTALADLPDSAQVKKEKANGVDALRYDYDRKNLEKLQGLAGGLTPGTALPENFKMSVWVSEKEKFPVKMMMTASGQEQGQKYNLDLQLNVTDLNNTSLKIETPR